MTHVRYVQVLPGWFPNLDTFTLARCHLVRIFIMIQLNSSCTPSFESVCRSFSNIPAVPIKRLADSITGRCNKTIRCSGQSLLTAGKSNSYQRNEKSGTSSLSRPVTLSALQQYSYIPHNCHGRHGRCPCKFFLPGVIFSRLNAKNLPFYSVI